MHYLLILFLQTLSWQTCQSKIDPVKIDEQKQEKRLGYILVSQWQAHPIGCPDAASVFIVTLSTSPNFLKCCDRLSLVAAK